MRGSKMGVRAGYLLGMLALLGTLSPTEGQVGLRAMPLINGPRIHGSEVRSVVGRGVFSRWPQEEEQTNQDHKNHSSNIEHSLAAIFRGVAYGLSPPSTTTTTTSTTTTTTTSTTPLPVFPVDGSSHANPPKVKPSIGPHLLDTAMNFDEEMEMNGFPDLYEDLIDALNGGEVDTQESWAGSLGVAWAVHVYCSASMFTMVGLLSLLLLMIVGSASRFLPLGHHLALHLLMLFAAISRCLHLFHDPYGTEGKLPDAIAGIVEDIGWPCLTAAIAVMIMALLQVWRCPPRSPPNHAPITLTVITVFHFLIAVFTQVLAVYFPKHSGPLRAASRTATAAWGGVVGLGSCVGTCRVIQAIQSTSNHMTVTVGRSGPDWMTQHTSASLLYAARLTLITTLVQVMLAGLHLYGLLGALITSHLPPPRPWHWLAFQSASSGLEVLAWVLLALISLPSVRDSRRKRRGELSRWKEIKTGTWQWCCGCQLCPTGSGGNRPIVQEETTPCKVADTRQGRPPYHSTAPSCTSSSSPYKQALLRSTASDAHLLWTHSRARDAPTSTCPPRPPAILNNDELSRLNKTQIHYTAPSAPPHSSLAGYDTQGEAPKDKPCNTDEDEPTAYDQHLYYNVATISREDSPAKPSLKSKRDAEGQTERLLQGQLNVDLHGADGDEDRAKSDLASLSDYSSTEPASPAVTADHDWSRNTTTTCSSVSAANSFDLRMFEDSDGTYYQLPYTKTPPPPPLPPPLNLRQTHQNYPSRSLAASFAELQEERRYWPFPEARNEAQRSHPDLMSHVGSFSFKWSSPPPHGSSKGLQRGPCASMGTMTSSGPVLAGRHYSTGEFQHNNTRQGKTLYSEQGSHGAARSISKQQEIMEHQQQQQQQQQQQERDIDHHIHVNPSESNTAVWHRVQSHPRLNRKQRLTGKGDNPSVREAPPPPAPSQNIDVNKRIQTAPRPFEPVPPHQIDGTTQTEVSPANSLSTQLSTPSPPPPRHPPPVFYPSNTSTPESEDPSHATINTNNRDILLIKAAAHHRGEDNSDNKHRLTYSVDAQAHDNAGENEFSEAHFETRQYQETHAHRSDLDRREGGSGGGGDLRHQEVQCGGGGGGESGQIYSGDRISCDGIDTLIHGGNHGEQEHTLINLSDAQSHETRPNDRHQREPRPGDRTRPHHHSGGHDYLVNSTGDRHNAHQDTGRPHHGHTGQLGDQWAYKSDQTCVARNT